MSVLSTLRMYVRSTPKLAHPTDIYDHQALHERYGDRGLHVLGSPSADFNNQEYAEAEEIGALRQQNYGVSFPLTERTSVRGEPSPLWSDLGRQPNSAAAP